MRRLVLADNHSDGGQRASNRNYGLSDCDGNGNGNGDRNDYSHCRRSQCDLHNDGNSNRDGRSQ